MSPLKEFINEIHRRSLWQVLAIYLVAIRRLTRARLHLEAPSLLREARLAARLGRIEEARRAYLAYLARRRDPEPGPAADAVAQARTELAALTPN